MLNSLPVGQVRQPRGVVKINDTVVSGCIEFQVKNSTYFEADTFSAIFARDLLPSAFDANFFSNIETDTFVEIFAGFPSDPANPNPDELDSLIYGRIDDVDFDPKNGTVELTGRDLTGAFIDNKQAHNYPNKTASFIATDLANQHGLSPNVTATTAKVGTVQETGDYQLLQTEGSDWDLITKLARESGFVAYVHGQTLFFGPETTDSDPYVIQWDTSSGFPQSNAEDLSFSRSLTVVKGVIVTAMSPGHKSKASITRSYPVGARSTTPGKAQPFGSSTVYTYTMKPDATATEVENFALAQYKLITSHAMKLKATLPGDNLLQTRGGQIQVTGSGTAFDQNYFVRSVTRRLSFSDGYTVSVEAQNFTDNQAASE